MCSWWWVELPPETCRASSLQKYNELYRVASCWTIIDAALSWRPGTHWKYLPFACVRSWKKGCRNILSMHMQVNVLHFITSVFTVQMLNLVETIYTCLPFPQICLRLSVYQPHVPRHCSTGPQNVIDTGFFAGRFIYTRLIFTIQILNLVKLFSSIFSEQKLQNLKENSFFFCMKVQ